MQIGNKVRNCDNFAAQVNLMHMGNSQSGSLGGGMISVGLSCLILGYLCMRMVAVVSYADPTINSYIVSEDRSKMNAPINLGDYG